MRHQPEFKLRMNIDELLNCVMVVAEWKHFLNEEHQGKVAGWSLQVWLHLKDFSELASSI